MGREEATGQGGLFVLLEYARAMRFINKKTTVAIQGFGNVGMWFAKLAKAEGFKIVAVSDSLGGIYDKNGLNIDKLIEYKKEKHFDGISNEELLSLDVDILVPAALENAIHKANAQNIKAKLILELANGPTTPEAEEVLLTKGIDILPDVLCNAGGVTVSYFEWVQNLHGYKWSKERVNEELKVIMANAFNEVYKVKKEKKVSYREAAYILAVKRIIDAMILRCRV